MQERLDEKEAIRQPEILASKEDGPASGADPLIGTVLDNKYRIDQFLGEGGFSRVYKATHLQLKKPVALKLLHEQFATDQDKRDRLTREARTTSVLNHPNIVRLHDFAGYADCKPYLVMDYVEGSSLAELLRKGRHFTIAECIQIASQACDALEAAHKQNIIHRDLKPENIMLLDDQEGRLLTVKLLDFGIAKVLQGEGDSLIARTQTGEVLGTPAYMSPEQCQGHQLGFSSDIYSLGCVIYELLTGAKAFSAESHLLIMLQHINKMPETFASAASGRQFPVALEAAVFKALAKKPGDRFRNAAGFKKALIEASAKEKSSLKSFACLLQSRSKARKADWRFLLITALCFCAVAAVSIAAFSFRQHQQAGNFEDTLSYSQLVTKLDQDLQQAKATHAPASQRVDILLRLVQLAPKKYDQEFENTIKLARDTRDAKILANLLDNKARRLLKSNPEEAAAAAGEAVNLASNFSEERDLYLKLYLNTLGMANYNARDFVNAEKAFLQCLCLRSKFALPEGEKPVKPSKQGDFWERSGLREEEELRWCLCKTYLAQNKLDEARQMFEKCMEIEQATGQSLRIKIKYNGLLIAKDRFEIMDWQQAD